MTLIGVGIVLHPDAEYLDLCTDIIENEVDFYELSPETLWKVNGNGHFSEGPWTAIMETILHRSGKPFVGHGLGLSPGTAVPPDEDDRLQKWLAQIARDQERFQFLWYTEHLGWIQSSGNEMVLPLPLPPTEESIQTVADRLGQLKPYIPTVGFENQVSYFAFEDARTEANFWNRICEAGDLWLLLDLHNAWTQCVNFQITMEEYLADLDLSHVLEIHLAGGSESNANWLPSGKVMRLDSHDNPVPEEVWSAFQDIRPKCPHLRAVVVERMDGTLTSDNIESYRAEVQRARKIFWEGSC